MIMGTNKELAMTEEGIVLSEKRTKLIERSMEIAETTAFDANAIGYMAKTLILATLPHRDPKVNEYTRCNGKYTLTMMAPTEIGLPYGSIPRLFLIWLSSVINKLNTREIPLGDSFCAFSKELGYNTGGKDSKRIKTQLIKLFSTSIMFYEKLNGTNNVEGIRAKNRFFAEDYNFWWQAKEPNQLALFDSYVILSEYFFNELMKIRIPLDMRAIHEFRDEPMAIDIYAWLTYRFSTLSRDLFISNDELQQQFGASYKRNNNFNNAFKDALEAVLTVYQNARVDIVPGRGNHTKSGILLHPSPPHVPKILIAPKIPYK